MSPVAGVGRSAAFNRQRTVAKAGVEAVECEHAPLLTAGCRELAAGISGMVGNGAREIHQAATSDGGAARGPAGWNAESPSSRRVW